MNEPVALKFSVIALSIGTIGAVGQTYLLHHELADCLLYKVVDADFYQSIARTGVWIAPILSVLLGAVFIRRRFWLSLILPVLFTPLVFAVTYVGFNLAKGYSMTSSPDAFGDLTTAAAAEQFLPYCSSLAATGLIIGMVSALLLFLIVRPRKLA